MPIYSPLHNKLHSNVNQISLFREACREPTRSIYGPRHTYMHTFATDIPYTILIYSQLPTHSKIAIHYLITCKLHQVGINIDGQPLKLRALLYGYMEARKNPFGKKYDRKSGQEPWPKLRAVSSPSQEASQLNKISFPTKINLSSVRGGRLVLRPRWTSRAILSLIHHCIITHGARV